MTFQVGSENKICFLFHSTHPRRVWRTYLEIRCAAWCFNPHTHKGVTVQHHRRGRWLLVSIHTPTKGVTGGLNYGQKSSCFNPHTHEGCDIWSISTPTTIICFNPHTHEGCDHLTGFTIKLELLFQSTHPRRVWHDYESANKLAKKFQSTHPRRVWLHIQQIAEYHDAKIIILRKMAK